MTPAERFRDMMRQRRKFPRGSVDWQWRTNAARKFVWLIIGKPTSEWGQ